MFYCKFLVKKVTWILMEFPCHFLLQIDGSLVQIDTKFHDYSMLLIQVLFVFSAKRWHGFWASSSHGICMTFAKATCRQKDTRKSVSHFLQETLWSIHSRKYLTRKPLTPMTRTKTKHAKTVNSLFRVISKNFIINAKCLGVWP